MMKIIKIELMKGNQLIDTIYSDDVQEGIMAQDLKSANGVFKKMTSGCTADLIEFEKAYISIININVRFYEVQKTEKLYKTIEKNKFGEWVVF